MGTYLNSRLSNLNVIQLPSSTAWLSLGLLQHCQCRSLLLTSDIHSHINISSSSVFTPHHACSALLDSHLDCSSSPSYCPIWCPDLTWIFFFEVCNLRPPSFLVCPTSFFFSVRLQWSALFSHHLDCSSVDRSSSPIHITITHWCPCLPSDAQSYLVSPHVQPLALFSSHLDGSNVVVVTH